MDRYKIYFRASAIIISFLSASPFLRALFEFDPVQLLCFGVIPGLWLLAWHGLKRSWKGCFAFSWMLTMLACCGSLEQLVELRMFVIRNHNFEAANGDGSPAAFMLYLVIYLAAFAGFLALSWLGFLVLRENRSVIPDNADQ